MPSPESPANRMITSDRVSTGFAAVWFVMGTLSWLSFTLDIHGWVVHCWQFVAGQFIDSAIRRSVRHPWLHRSTQSAATAGRRGAAATIIPLIRSGAVQRGAHSVRDFRIVTQPVRRPESGGQRDQPGIAIAQESRHPGVEGDERAHPRWARRAASRWASVTSRCDRTRAVSPNPPVTPGQVVCPELMAVESGHGRENIESDGRCGRRRQGGPVARYPGSAPGKVREDPAQRAAVGSRDLPSRLEDVVIDLDRGAHRISVLSASRRNDLARPSRTFEPERAVVNSSSS